MCGRYYSRRQKQEIADHFRASKVFEEPLAPNYNIAPATFRPVVRLEHHSGDRELVLMRSGLVPHFVRYLLDFKGFRGLNTFNARAEMLTTSVIWRTPFNNRRCIIPADGFYEWKRLDDSPKPAKQPYAISMKSGEPFAFAGLWGSWKDPIRGLRLGSFSIVTTEANEIMAPIHTRMPAILQQRDWTKWLDSGSERPAPLNLLRPYDSEEMRIECCNPAVGNVRNNSASVVMRESGVIYPRERDLLCERSKVQFGL
jgi:putative SOS response-associated peptidase YedK